MSLRWILFILFSSLFFLFLIGGISLLLVQQYRDTGSVKEVVRQVISPTPVPSVLRTPIVTPTITPQLPEAPVISLLFVGDIMLDRYVRTLMRTYGEMYPFEKISSLLSGHDAVIGNLEGPITSYASKASEPNILTFTFDPSVAPLLKSLGFTHLSLANNHAFDFGAEGNLQTRSILDAVGLRYFGAYNNDEPLSVVTDIQGATFAFVGYHALSGRSSEPVLQEIERLRADTEIDYILVMPHWGNEYQSLPSARQSSTAHDFINAGADAVLGSHPHVVQPIEVYKGKFIAYSLGNFVFDQTFSRETQQGLAVELRYHNNVLEIVLTPLESSRSQIALPYPESRDSRLFSLAADSIVDESLREQIRNGHIFLNVD